MLLLSKHVEPSGCLILSRVSKTQVPASRSSQLEKNTWLKYDVISTDEEYNLL